MTRKGSGANVSNGTNASNGEKTRGSRERGSEREKGPLGVLPAGSDLDAFENERRNEDTPNEAFELEKPGMLPRSQVTAIQNLRRKNWSIDKIHATTGIAKSTVHKYCKNITPTGADDIEIEYRPNPEQITQLQTLRRQGMSNEELSKLFKWSLDIILEATRGVELDPAIASRQSQQAAEEPSSPPSTPAQPKLSYEVTTSNRPQIIEDGDESQDQISRGGSVQFDQHGPMVIQSNNGGSFNDVISKDSHYVLAGQMSLDKCRDINDWIQNRMVSQLDVFRSIKAWLPGESDEQVYENFKGIALDARTYREKESRWDHEFREKIMKDEQEKRNKP